LTNVVRSLSLAGNLRNESATKAAALLRTEAKHQANKQLGLDSVPPTAEQDRDDESADSYEYILQGLEVVKRKKEKLKKQDWALMTTMSLDTKPYFPEQTLREWELRLQRLEQKMNVLAPQLVALSFVLHERALALVSDKLKRYLAREMRLDDLAQEKGSLENKVLQGKGRVTAKVDTGLWRARP
jgi:hypothetical protein